VERLDSFRASRINLQADGIMSALERADVEDEMVDWLEERGLDAELAGPLVEPGVTLDELKSLASDLPEEGLDAALRWIGAGCAANMLAREIRAAAGRVNELVAAFKSFTYMDRKATPEAVELEPGLRDTMRVLASKAKSRDASVRLTVEPDLPLVHAVGSELNQVWMNLIDNALDAVSQAGEIDITVARELDRMVVRVVDNGSGIPEDVMDHIFDPFYTTKPPGEGTGLGLEIARQIVRRYQGDIFAVSRPGRTEFTVSLMPRE
jgi:C4-dicarboxylate-specific signal transduction histidine kinase